MNSKNEAPNVDPRPLERPVGPVEDETGPGLSGSAFVMPTTEEGKLIVKLTLSLKDMLEFINEMPDFFHPVIKKEIKQTAIYNRAQEILEKAQIYERKSFFKSSSLNNASDVSLAIYRPPLASPQIRSSKSSI